jgi:TolB-like protein/Flp pilus assembly protein TadD
MEALITPADWRRIGDIFDEAMALDRPRRAGFVRAKAKGETLLQEEVMRLLRSDDESTGLLDEPISLVDLFGPDSTADDGPRPASIGLAECGPPATVYSEGDLLIGRFRIVRKLDAGGMGEVFEAADTFMSGARIALKTISAELAQDVKSREAFRTEVLAARAVTHSGVCRIHDLHDDPERGNMFLTMELLEGRNLSRILKERKEVDFAESARLFLQIAEAVAAAHAANVLHCDIKPSNVIVVSDAKGTRPVVTDFGLARVAGSFTGYVGGGTPDYMAPELFNRQAPTFASDVFSLGVLAVELLTGERLPHRLSDLTGISRPAPSPALPGILKNGQWSKLVGRCLESDPSRRFPSAVELAAAVDSLIGRTARFTRRAAFAATIAMPLGAYYTYERMHPAGLTGVAILPFEDRSPGQNVHFLADSIPGELIRTLGPVSGLRVTALTSTSRYRGASVSPVDIARLLNVDYVVQGSVEAKDGGVVLNVAAVSRETGRSVWKHEFRRAPGGSNLALRQEVVLALAGELPLALAPAQIGKLRGQPTTDSAAYDKYLLATQLGSNRPQGWLSSSIDLLTEATSLAPDFALAYARLSSLLFFRVGNPAYSDDETMRREETAAERALQLDDSLPEAHQAMGTVRQHRYFDWAGAESQFRAATRLNPGLASAHQALAGLLSNLRRVPEALAEVGIARELDPRSLSVNALYGAILERSYRTEEAISQLKFTIELAPSNIAAWILLGDTYAQKADWREAEAAYRQSLGIDPADESSRAGLAYVLARTGRIDEANSLVKALAGERASQVSIASAYIGLNRFDDAALCLETAWQRRDPTISSIAAEPVNDQLRQNPRFTALLKKMSLP